MRLALLIVPAGCLLALPALAQEQHREAGAHVHGRGTLNIAIEGPRLTMELEAPGADIVGFEHAATTAKDKKAVHAARATLSNPAPLFKLPAAARCRVVDSRVELKGDRDGHDHDDKDGHQRKTEGDKPPRAGHDEHAHEHHAEFFAEYTLECAAPERITDITFGYFEAFAGTRELQVRVITPKGQTEYEVSRDKPRLDLAGLI